MSVQVTILIDEAIKQRFESVCESLGSSPSNVINTFTTSVVKSNRIPFDEPLMLVPDCARPVRKTPKLGGCEDKIWMADDFDAPMEEFEEYM